MEPSKQTKPKSGPIGGLADRAATAAHQSIDDMKDRASRAGHQANRKSRAGAKRRPAGKPTAKPAVGMVKRVTNYIEEHPFGAVVLAFGVGILATTMLRATGVNLAQLLAGPEDAGEDLAD